MFVAVLNVIHGDDDAPQIIDSADLTPFCHAGALEGTADFVCNGQVLHCMPEEDCQKFLRNAWRLLRPGGSVYGTSAGVAEAREWTYTTDGQGYGMLYDKVL